MVRISRTLKQTQKIHIWAAFSSMGTFPLCIFTQNLNAELFVKILEVDWPSQSPDINPILENLFAGLKQKLIKKGP